jgi:phosphoglycolate phosphatase-like HAD superfamily hydrolase
MLGRAPIVDFDGTLARLGVDWAGLRARLGLTSLDELWTAEPGAGGGGDLNSAGWRAVTAAEVAAALRARPVEPMVAALARCEAFAVLTGNSQAAVDAFLDRRPELGSLCRAVAGRETLRGSKRDPATFSRGFQLCADATEQVRGGDPLVYVGDLAWELAAARQLGALAIDVTEVR